MARAWQRWHPTLTYDARHFRAAAQGASEPIMEATETQGEMPLDEGKPEAKSRSKKRSPSPAQREWLTRGLKQAGGKLPLFDKLGQRIPERTVKSCLQSGWAEPWFSNPIKPDWLVCKLTENGRKALG